MNDSMQMQETGKPGRKPQISNEQILEAAATLQSQGRDITGWALRDVIGSGGPKYMIRVWEEYRASQGDIVQTEEIPAEQHILPPELESKVQVLLGNLHAEIESFARESDALANSTAEKKARAAYEAMMESNKKLVAEQDLADKIIEEADERAEQLESELSEAKQEIASVEASLTSTRGIADKNASDLAQMTRERDKADSKVKELEKQTKQLSTENTKLETRLADKEESLSSVKAELKQTSSELSKSEKHASSLESEVKSLGDSVSKLDKLQASSQSEITELREKYGSASKEVAKLQASLDAQQKLLDEKDKRIADLEKAAKKTEDSK